MWAGPLELDDIKMGWVSLHYFDRFFLHHQTFLRHHQNLKNTKSIVREITILSLMRDEGSRDDNA